MASAEFDEEALEKRPTVQVGDPFLEKLLLEACLEAMRAGSVAGIQDMGAAGLTSSSCEMAARAGNDNLARRLLWRTDGAYDEVPAGRLLAGILELRTGNAALAVDQFDALVRQQPVADDVGMTGEITLTGQVLPIGGIREKSLAAQRAGLKRVIMPRENEPDLAELPTETKRELEFILVDSIDEVFEAAFNGAASGRAKPVAVKERAVAQPSVNVATSRSQASVSPPS